jgi:hypothetical protein
MLCSKFLLVIVRKSLPSAFFGWFKQMILERTEPQFGLQLLQQLQSENIKAYRFCGGFVLKMMQHSFPNMQGDLDLWVQPQNDLSFLSSLPSPHLDILKVDKNKTERTPQEVHDIKYFKKHEEEHVLDLVFRKDVFLCSDIDAPCCKSGLLWTGETFILEIYDYMNIRQGKMLIEPFMSEARRLKMEGKGFQLL